MIRRVPSMMLAAALMLTGGAAAFAQGDADTRGRALYEARCGGCHDRSVHQRTARTATSFAAVRASVERWEREVSARWRPDEIDAVARYLNERYYRLPCEAPGCVVRRSAL